MKQTKAEQLILGINALQNKIEKRVSGPLSAHGISFNEYLVLHQLAKAPDQRMRRIDLAEGVGLSASGVTRLLNPMEKIGLVLKEENARDARVSLVVLSETGTRIFQEASVSFQHAGDSVFASLDDKKRTALAALLLELN